MYLTTLMFHRRFYFLFVSTKLKTYFVFAKDFRIGVVTWLAKRPHKANPLKIGSRVTLIGAEVRCRMTVLVINAGVLVLRIK